MVLKNFGGVPVLKFLQTRALDFPYPYYLSVIFPGIFSQTNVQKIWFQVFQRVERPQFFSVESLGMRLYFTIHIFFKTAVLQQLFDITRNPYEFLILHVDSHTNTVISHALDDVKTVTRSIASMLIPPVGQLSGICQFFRKRCKCPMVGPGSSYKNSMVGLKKVCKFLACVQSSSLSQKKSGEETSVNHCR